MTLRPTGPPAAWVLGLIAILPFPVSAVLFSWGPARFQPGAAMALLTCSAAIVCFMGGSRWGLETARVGPRWGVLAPALASPIVTFGLWMLTAADAVAWRLGGFMALFLAVWIWDTVFSDLPRWYSQLRSTVTIVACVSLALALEKALRM